MAPAAVKATSRRGEAGELPVHQFRRNLHQIRHISPDQGGPDGTAGVKPSEHDTIERELTHIGNRDILDSPWRRTIGLVVRDQYRLLRHHQAVDLTRHRDRTTLVRNSS